ncbi:beta-glucosidase BglX [Sphingopyxis alaskensis]|jgi:beta-glucosidase|uniref:Periplasmic beta-glucosidase n=1 Tax=Sphingopyxis alaskensis (strain DSM 13593 / LMG 18877 / RB2256) TaxID=317655 RepID=Q1GUE1_SPHAL|nr:beta-glucosidase BglX [Sphingopyxis alaskensis]ABF52731.1 glycoside hydrolase, family 3-like protein [Sphingopyxis alaskensis RB2256]MCM3418266.1 beta-glucosidase BglX [Sphingopyxis alaskensis]
MPPISRNLTSATLATLLVAGSLAPAPLTAAPAATASDKAPVDAASWQRADPAMDRFIADLMVKMTLDEKTGQLTLLTSNWESTGPTMRDSYKEDIRAGRVGAIFNAYTAKYTRELQALAVEGTRLKIPLLFGYDVIHGHRTIFPISLGEAASWDLQAIEKAARISAIEASAEGIHWTFSPMVDIARDPRWGRISEGAGEDVYLGSLIAKARVRGYQGGDLSRPDTILATAKHFAAYGAAQAGRDYHTVDISERTMRDVYLPPFKAAADAGAATFMTAFNEYDGVPASGSHYLLTDVLRKKWGFKGFVVTDYTSINEMVPHGYAKDLKQAGEQAMRAGVDMDMQGAVFMENLAKSVAEGKVDTARIDAAVKAILEMKYRLGLFDDPYRYADAAREKATIYKPAFLEAARDVARKSIVLLKNKDNVLPLAASAKSIAVIGPLGNSKEDMIGSWSAAGDRRTRPVTLLEGLQAGAPKGTTIAYAKGASYHFDDVGKTDGFAEALALAEKSDVIIAAMGEHWNMTGEAASRTSLDLPGNQQALLEALEKTGKPVILVLMSGRPNSIEWADANVDAILEAWYPGTMGGHAIADILYGRYNPSGKLPVTFPRTVGQVPIHYDMKNTGRPIELGAPGAKYVSRYLNTPNTPLYPFGYGLSYTSFTYSPVTLDRSKIRPGEPLTASVTVTNSGPRDGEEVVQLYVRDLVGSVTRPVKELKGFQKIGLKKGETRTVRFTLTDADLAFTRQDMSWGSEPGAFKLWIGPSSAEGSEASFELTE